MKNSEKKSIGITSSTQVGHNSKDMKLQDLIPEWLKEFFTEGSSAEYYKNNSSARKKKAETDKKINARPEQVKKRMEANNARRKAKKAGKDIKGKDASHTKDGIVFKEMAKNRGSKSDGKGDKNARGGGKRKK